MLLTGLALIMTTDYVISSRPCAYWCEGSCTKKVTSFYCCSYEPSLIGPQRLLEPPCRNLCLNRTNNKPVYYRNCKTELEELRLKGEFRFCRNFNDCDPKFHDLCCSDNCLPNGVRMCVKQ